MAAKKISTATAGSVTSFQHHIKKNKWDHWGATGVKIALNLTRHFFKD